MSSIKLPKVYKNLIFSFALSVLLLSCAYKNCRSPLGIMQIRGNSNLYKKNDWLKPLDTVRFYRYRRFLIYSIPTVHHHILNKVDSEEISDVVYVFNVRSKKVLRIDSSVADTNLICNSDSLWSLSFFKQYKLPISNNLVDSETSNIPQKEEKVYTLKNHDSKIVITSLFKDTFRLRFDSLVVNNSKKGFPYNKFFSKKDMNKNKKFITSVYVYTSYSNEKNENCLLSFHNYYTPFNFEEKRLFKLIDLYKQIVKKKS